MNPVTQHHRKLDIEGTYNVRDLGGYTVTETKVTKWRAIFRADKLNRITPAGQNTIIELGIRTIIDLRYSPEVEFEPDVFTTSADIRYLHLPLYELSGNSSLPRVPDDLIDLYKMILDYRQSRVAEIVSILMASENQPALFHCTAGKDRTGIIAALLLGSMGVSDEDIVEDYALTGAYLLTLREELRQQARINGYDSEWYDRLMLCEPATMAATLAHLQSSYGGVLPYLLHCGLSSQQIQRFTQTFIDPSPIEEQSSL